MAFDICIFDKAWQFFTILALLSITTVGVEAYIYKAAQKLGVKRYVIEVVIIVALIVIFLLC